MMRCAEIGVRSDGFRMKELPQAIASGSIHMGTMKGKLNGVMPATTPTGKRTISESMPRETWSRFCPIKRVGAPQAKSTTSMPRRTSPVASLSTFPFSVVTSLASASRLSSIASRSLKR